MEAIIYCEKGKQSDVTLVHNKKENKNIVCKDCDISRPNIIKNKETGDVKKVPSDYPLYTRKKALQHMIKHHIRGQKIPNRALTKIQDEIKSRGDKL